MLKYGHSFDTTFDPARADVYTLLINIYGDPLLTKTKDQGTNSVYTGKTSCFLLNECRYLIATIPLDEMAVGEKSNLSKLYWTNFQTRTLKGKFKCESCKSASSTMLSPPLELVKRTDEFTQYKDKQYNLNVSLLHTKKNNLYEHPNNGDIISALELYNTIISF